ncbi:hypothetical protein RRG08_009356 [Elysia crispata]|uniref:Reverse transcriptase domain-containing protein n=1 Tax=Elysia crispata TaxID=231223 RepID=A0AAE0Z185_9GAST|nr:hypothetical protein RRG08_009356 [Elysia crispata]
MGCTISPILFVMALEVILKAAEDSAGPANLGGGCHMPPLKAYIGDTTIICSKTKRRTLERLDVLMAWCRMKFKPKKSRSLSVRKREIDATTIFTVANQQIPTVSKEPVKSLGRMYDSSMKYNKKRTRNSRTCYRRPASHQKMWPSGQIQSVVPTVHANSEASLASHGL